MYNFRIGAMLDSFKLDTKTSIETAAKIGVEGLQMYATSGEHAPENMTKEDRRELLDMVKSNGLVFSAICGDLGCGFSNPDKNPELIERSKRILELAKDLETDVVTTHIGVVPCDKAHPRYKIMHAACLELCKFADSLNAHFAIETGPERAAVLKEFLNDLGDVRLGRELLVQLDKFRNSYIQVVDKLTIEEKFDETEFYQVRFLFEQVLVLLTELYYKKGNKDKDAFHAFVINALGNEEMEQVRMIVTNFGNKDLLSTKFKGKLM